MSDVAGGKIDRGYKIAIWHIPTGDLVMEAEVHERVAPKVDELIRTAIVADQKAGKRPQLKLET